MRRLVITAVFASLLAAPVFAQSYDPNNGTGNIVFPPSWPNVSSPVVAPWATDSAGPYAYEPGPAPRRLRHVRHVRHVHRIVRHHDMQKD